MNRLKIIGIILVAVVIVLGYLGTRSNQRTGGVVQNAPTYTTASSTVYTIGHQASTKVLDQASRRGYAIFCNAGVHKAYLNFSSTAITATTTADVAIPANTCYEINNQNLYVGEVQAIQETASSTATFIVTELRD